ncbi:MAG: RidA family protein [Actinomycetota bacterium]|nr:RidA family protein [Actinomycetota bacterium]
MTNPSGPPYTPAVRAGDWLVVSGQIGVLDGALVSGGFEAEMRQTLINLQARLHEHGAALAQVTKTTVFLADLDDYAPMNAIYSEAFPEPRPARSAFAVARLPFDACVEIEAWVWLA